MREKKDTRDIIKRKIKKVKGAYSGRRRACRCGLGTEGRSSVVDWEGRQR
jgi:hypothetical protein